MYCVVPERMSGGYYFAERFPILWILFLLAGASACRLPRGWSTAAGALAATVTVFALAMQWANVSEIGARIALANDTGRATAGSVGVIVGLRRGMPDGLAFNPYLWCGAHYFRRSRAILANEPWMDESVMMLRPARPDRWSYRDPDAARQELEHAKADGTSQGPDFVVQAGQVDGALDRVVKDLGWSDSGPANRWIRVYERR